MALQTTSPKQLSRDTATVSFRLYRPSLCYTLMCVCYAVSASLCVPYEPISLSYHKQAKSWTAINVYLIVWLKTQDRIGLAVSETPINSVETQNAPKCIKWHSNFPKTWVTTLEFSVAVGETPYKLWKNRMMRGMEETGEREGFGIGSRGTYPTGL